MTKIIRINLPVAGGLLSHCRHLLDQRHDPRDICEVYRDDTLCFVPTRLGWFASKTVSENDTTSARFAWYRPRPEAAA